MTATHQDTNGRHIRIGTLVRYEYRKIEGRVTRLGKMAWIGDRASNYDDLTVIVEG